MRPLLILFFFFTLSFGVVAQDTISVHQNQLILLLNEIKVHPSKDTIRVQLLMDYANLCFYHLDFLSGFKAANEARSISKEINFKKGEGLYLKSISIFRRRINAGNAYIKTKDINKVNEVNESINNLDIYYEVEGNRVLGQYTDFDLFGNIIMPVGIRDSEIETMIYGLEEALSYYSEKENLEITAYLQDALSFIYFNTDKEKSRKHMKVAQGLYKELNWSYHQLLILAKDIDDFLGQGMEAEAKPLEIEAINIYTNEADKYIKAHCALLLSKTYGIHNRVNLQLEYLFQAEELLTEIGEKDLLKSVYWSFAVVYEWYLTNSEKALEYEYKELNLRKEINYYERVAYTYLLISESLFGLNKIQEFPPEYRDYLKVGSVKGSLLFDAELLWAKARMLQAQGKSEEAQSVFQASIEAYMKYNDRPGASWAACDLAESYKSVGDLKNAFKYAHKSFDWASEVNLLPRLIRTAGLLSQMYVQTGNESKAYTYLKIYKEAKEKEERLNNAANRSELEIQGVLKKRQRDIELLEAASQLKEQENKTQRVWLFSIAGALVSLVFLSFILVRNNRQKHKANLVLNSINKELEIEAALERVRTRTMAMHNSEALKEIIGIVFSELSKLELPLTRVAIWIFDRETASARVWIANPEGDSPLNSFYLPYNEFPNYLGVLEAWNKKEKSWEYLLIGQEKDDWADYLFNGTDFSVLPQSAIDMMRKSPQFTYHATIHDFGCLHTTVVEPLSRDQLEIYHRFGKVFDQTYTRFLDLQKAEAQAREAQIEASLERIRSRTMGMQKTDELKEIVALLYEECNKFGFASVLVILNTRRDEDDGFNWWFSANEQTILPQSYFIPDIDEPVLRDIKSLWESGKPGGYIQMGGNVKVEHDRRLFSETGLRELPNQLKELMRSYESVFLSIANMKNGFIEVDANAFISEEQANILQRYAKVFEQTYTRFVDLQKAEAQAREAQIQLALERVRARTMAMHKSAELSEVSALLYKELQGLGVIRFINCGYVEIDEPGNIQHAWMTIDDGSGVNAVLLPLTGDKVFDERYDAWKRKEKIFHQSVGGDLLKSHIEFSTQHYRKTEIDEMVRARFADPTIFYCSNFSHGYLHIVTDTLLSEEYELLLIRFTRVFEMTYKRFLDLQKAEAQARESEIQLALERVRARTMAMQKSDELREVVGELFHQVQSLGIEIQMFVIFIFKPDGGMEWWGTEFSEKGLPQSYNIPSLEEFTNHSRARNLIEIRRNKTPYQVFELSGKEKKNWDQFLLEKTGLEQLPAYIKKGMRSLDKIVLCDSVCEHGILEVAGQVVLSGEHENILQRFSKVFEQTYTRFLDVQKAEIQAREAQIEAALERVRSRTMGMQRSDELQEAALLLFQQVIGLGVPAFGSGFNIWDEDRKFSTAWMAGQDRLQPPFKTSSSEDIFLRIYESAQRGEALFVEEQGGEALKVHYDCMNSIPVFKDIADKMAAVGQSFPTFQIMHCAFFSQGYLMFITFEPVPNAFDIFRRFAKVFEQTYTRFLDLQKAEAQAREAQIEAALERVRARSMAMHKSDELADVVSLMYAQIQNLGFTDWGCAIILCDEEAQIMRYWYAEINMSHSPEYFTVPLKNKTIQKVWKSWKQGVPQFTIELLNKEKDEFTEYMLTETDHKNLPDEVKEGWRSVENVFFCYTHIKYGFLEFDDIVPFAQENILVYQRFAKVFEQAYTRFLDLQKAEAQALRAEQDLLEIRAARKKAEEALEKLKSTQAQLIQSEKMASLGELTAGIAHEIQNPLNFINNFSEVSSEMIDELNEELGKGELGEVKSISGDLKENLKKINHHGNRASIIVKGMLEHSRNSSGKKEPTDINALAEEYLRLAYHALKAGMRAKDESFNAVPITIGIKTNLDPDLPLVDVVPQEFGRVLLNLINNAFQAIDEKAKNGVEGYKPELVVSTRQDENSIQIIIADNGPGIPDEIKDKIFQPFFTTKPTGKGTGLGLSLSYDIVKAHGGALRVETKEGEGSRFIIQLLSS